MAVYLNTDGEPVEIGEGRGDLRGSSQPFSMFENWDGGPFVDGRPVSYAKIFTTQQWVGIAVMRLLTWSVRVPLKVYKRLDDDGGRRRLLPREHPLARAVVSPWEGGTMAAFVTSLLGPVSVQGNALTDVHDGAGNQIRFEPIDWRTVVPLRFNDQDPNDKIVGWNVHSPGESPASRSSRTVMHLRWWSPLGQLGISPLRHLGATIAVESAAMNWTLGILKQSARPSGVVEISDEALKLEATKRQQLYDQAVDDMRDAYGGDYNAGKLPILPPGMKWTTSAHTTAVEAELMAQRQANKNEVAAMFMIPPAMIGQLEKANYSNMESQRAMAYTDGLAPPLILAEQQINAHVVEGLLREDDVFVEFDFAGVLRGDRLKEIQALREAIGSGLMKPNEGRDVLNLVREDAEQADKLFIPRNNMQPLEDADTPDLNEVSNAAQRLAQAVKQGLLSEEEARGLIGLSGPAPDSESDGNESSTGEGSEDDTGDANATANTTGHLQEEVNA